MLIYVNVIVFFFAYSGDKFNVNDLEKKPMRIDVMKKMLETSRMFFV